MAALKPRLSARALKPIIGGLEALGHAVEPVLAEAGLARATLTELEARLPVGAGARVWQAAVARTGDERLGLHLARAAPLQSFDMHAYAMLSSPTLRDAFHRACRYQHLINEGTELTFTGTPDGVLRHSLPGGRSVPRQPAEFLATAWLRLGRVVTGTAWVPTEVRFAHERPADTSEYDALFGVAVQFNTGQTAMHIPAPALDLPNQRADATLVSLLDSYAATLLEQQPAFASESARVRAWLVEAHTTGAPRAEQAAKALAMSVRTLHRRLKSEGTTFQALLDQFRHEKAVSLLNARRHSIAEVAFLLGYSELSAFYRAFRRWTGTAPAKLREEAPPA